MSAAREEILTRVRAALRDVPAAEHSDDVTVARAYRRHGERSPDQLLACLTDRLLDYHAAVRRVDAGGVGAAVAQACHELGLERVAIPPGLPRSWRPDGVRVIEDRGLSAHELDALDGAVTGCAAAIAETGTLVLDGQELSGRRVLTLVPNHHICIVHTDQVVDQVPEAVAGLAPAVREQGVPVTLVSGPSASSDIELQRIEGVHGPRHLLVLLIV
jgi:L-lactate dehydrogenase complex protein LldG